MGEYYCMKCGETFAFKDPSKQEAALIKAKEHCLGMDSPCHKCIAKNLCLNKDVKNPMQNADKFRAKTAGGIWEKRGCA